MKPEREAPKGPATTEPPELKQHVELGASAAVGAGGASLKAQDPGGESLAVFAEPPKAPEVAKREELQERIGYARELVSSERANELASKGLPVVGPAERMEIRAVLTEATKEINTLARGLVRARTEIAGWEKFSEQLGEAHGFTYQGDPFDPGPDPCDFDLFSVKQLKQERDAAVNTLARIKAPLSNEAVLSDALEQIQAVRKAHPDKDVTVVIGVEKGLVIQLAFSPDEALDTASLQKAMNENADALLALEDRGWARPEIIEFRDAMDDSYIQAGQPAGKGPLQVGDKIRTQIMPYEPDGNPPIGATIDMTNGGLSVDLDGYGAAGMAPGNGGPISFDYYEGNLRLLVWGDINQEDPTHTIDLKGALESNRVEEAEPQRRVTKPAPAITPGSPTLEEAWNQMEARVRQAAAELEVKTATRPEDWAECEDGTIMPLLRDNWLMHQVVPLMRGMAEALAEKDPTNAALLNYLNFAKDSRAYTEDIIAAEERRNAPRPHR